MRHDFKSADPEGVIRRVSLVLSSAPPVAFSEGMQSLRRSSLGPCGKCLDLLRLFWRRRPRAQIDILTRAVVQLFTWISTPGHTCLDVETGSVQCETEVQYKSHQHCGLAWGALLAVFVK